jgi:hypothetical protein
VSGGSALTAATALTKLHLFDVGIDTAEFLTALTSLRDLYLNVEVYDDTSHAPLPLGAPLERLGVDRTHDKQKWDAYHTDSDTDYEDIVDDNNVRKNRHYPVTFGDGPGEVSLASFAPTLTRLQLYGMDLRGDVQQLRRLTRLQSLDMCSCVCEPGWCEPPALQFTDLWLPGSRAHPCDPDLLM